MLSSKKYDYTLLLTSLGLILTSFSPIQAQEFFHNSQQQEKDSYFLAQDDLNIYNTNVNPLLFPTQTEEVEIENIQAITLVEAIEIALENNEELQVAQLELDRSEQSLKRRISHPITDS